MINLTLLQEQAEELINCGNSKEIAEGYGMMKVIKEIHKHNIEIVNDIAHEKLYVVGKSYRYSEIPEEDTEEYTVSDYGLEYLGQNAIHVRYHKTETDVWFIYEKQLNEGIFKCVYNS